MANSQQRAIKNLKGKLRAVSVYEANEFNLIEVAQLRFKLGIWVFRVRLKNQLGSVVLIGQGNANQICTECI